jgi:hypothetical protein
MQLSDLSSLPVPSDEQKKKYINSVDELPAPGAGELDALPAPTEQQKAQYVSSIDSLPSPTEESVVPDRSFFDRPGLKPETFTDAEVEKIAKARGVPVDTLRQALPYFAAIPENASAADYAKFAAGTAGEAVGLGIPQKIYRATQPDNVERALDDLYEIAQQKKSYAQLGAEALAPGLGAIKVGQGIKGAAMTGAAIGGIAGAAASRKGEELRGAGIGAVGGAAIGGVAEGLASFLARKGGSRAGTVSPRERCKGLRRFRIPEEASYIR